jgi:HSP20 family protein
MNTTTPGTHDRLLAQLAAIPACQESFEEADWFPPVDILEDTEEYLFKIDLPDVKAENIQVTVEEDRMVISGERPNPWLADRKHLRVERPHGHFERRFALPDDASRQEISTLFAENVLEVHVRKVSPPAETPVATSAPPRLKLHSPS